MGQRRIRFTAFMEHTLSFPLDQGQRALARVMFDGDDPGTIEDPTERAVALELLGGALSVPPSARGTYVLRCGRASGKSLLAAGYGLYRACTADLSSLVLGRPAVVVVSTRLGKSELGGGGSASEILTFARQLATRQNQRLAEAVTNEQTGGFIISLPGRPPVRFMSAPADPGGKAVRSIDILNLIIDESEFIATTTSEAGITDTAIIAAARPRIIEGGSVLLLSTPWPAPSETSRLFDENYGHPSRALVARGPTLVMRRGSADWDRYAKDREEVMESDPATGAREYDCELVDGGGMFFEASTIDAAVSRETMSSQYERVSAGIDPAFRNDSFSLVVGERQGAKFVILRVEERRPMKGKALVPSAIIGEFRDIAKGLGAHHVVTDQHAFASVQEHARPLETIPGPSMTGVRLAAFEYLRQLFREYRIVIPDDKKLLVQLKSVQAKAQPGGGLKIILPHTASGHADSVSALVNAAWIDRRNGPLVGAIPVERIRGPAAFSGLVPPEPVKGEITERQPMGQRSNPFIVNSGFTKW